jgi:hypothetical protein
LPNAFTTANGSLKKIKPLLTSFCERRDHEPITA